MKSKGSMADMLQSMIFIFIMGFVLLVASYLKDQIYPELQAELGSRGDTVITVSEGFFNIVDYMFVFFAVGLNLAAIILAYLSRFNPIFFFMSIVIVGINLILAPVFSNVMLDIWSEPEFTTYQTSYPMMVFMFQYFPHFVNIMSTILVIAMFARSRAGGWGL